MSAHTREGKTNPAALTKEDPSHPLVALAHARLQVDDYPVLRNVRCTFRQGRLILRGRLPTFFLKQRAQEIINALKGRCQIVNLIQVD